MPLMDEGLQIFVSGICIKCFRAIVAPQHRNDADRLHTELVSKDHSTEDDASARNGDLDGQRDLCILCRCCELDGSCRLFGDVKFLTCLKDTELHLEAEYGTTENESSKECEFSVYRLFDAIKPGLKFEDPGETFVHKGFNFCILAIHLINNVAMSDRFKRTFLKNLLQVSSKGMAELPEEWDVYVSRLGSNEWIAPQNICSQNEDHNGGHVEHVDHLDTLQTAQQVVDYRLRQEVLNLLLDKALEFKNETKRLYKYMEIVCKDRLLFEQLIRLKVNVLVEGSPAPRVTKFSLSRDTITFTGTYNKYTRGLSQTLWILDNKIVVSRDAEYGNVQTPISIEECIGAPLNYVCGSREYKFMASGREDSDVRTFGKGRMFCIEMYDCTRDVFEILQMSFSGLSSSHATGMNNAADVDMLFTGSLEGCKHVQHADARLLWEYFTDACPKDNAPANRITFGLHNLQPSTEFRNLRISFNSRVERQRVQNDAEGKLKSYNCLVFSAEPLDLGTLKRDIECPISIKQRNPVRISHRRSQDVRNRTIYSLAIDPLHPRLFILSISTQAGTYVKEFVTGDLGRTRPSLKGLLGSSDLHVLCLDVLDIQS